MATVRLATRQDGDAIGRIQVETWRTAYKGLLPDDTVTGFDVDVQQQTWRGRLVQDPRPGHANFVAELDGEVVGFASMGAARDEDGVGELYAIYAHPSCWGRGVGRALIKRAEQSLRAAGFREALLWVLEGNERAERFYRAAGWTHDGSKEDEFQGAAVVERRYRKSL
jgi:GNAT superfamily N-acetyltransferase